MIILLFLVGLVIGWIIGNPLAWAVTARPLGLPFNWRIFAGPWLYLDWAYDELSKGDSN